MSCCPRCVQPVAPDAGTCSHCGYDIAAVDALALSATSLRNDLRTLPPAPVLDLPGYDAVPSYDALPDYDAWPDQDDPNDHEDLPTAETAELDEPIEPIESLPPVEPIEPTEPDEAAQPDPASRSSWQSRLPVVIAVAAVAIVAVVAVLHPGDHGSIGVAGAGGGAGAGAAAQPTPSKSSAAPLSAQQQAAVIQGYLSQSAAARSGVSDAIGSINGCHNVAAAVTTLSNAANARSQILTGLKGAQVSALPGGTEMLTDLQQALQASATADHDYAAWGSAVAAACVGQAAHTSDYSTAQQSDTIATAAKQRFVKSWNPVAAQFGLPAQSASIF